MNHDLSHLFDHIQVAAHLTLGGCTLGPVEFEGTLAAYVLPASRLDSEHIVSAGVTGN